MTNQQTETETVTSITKGCKCPRCNPGGPLGCSHDLSPAEWTYGVLAGKMDELFGHGADIPPALKDAELAAYSALDITSRRHTFGLA